jgi:hypothetical protein
VYFFSSVFFLEIFQSRFFGLLISFLFFVVVVVVDACVFLFFFFFFYYFFFFFFFFNLSNLVFNLVLKQVIVHLWINGVSLQYFTGRRNIPQLVNESLIRRLTHPVGASPAVTPSTPVVIPSTPSTSSTPLNIGNVAAALQSAGVPASGFQIDGVHEPETKCDASHYLSETEEGDFEVGLEERGSRFPGELFDDEHDASLQTGNHGS